VVDAGRVFTHSRAHRSLDLDACWRLLATERLGRIALSVAALPAVVPVQYRLVGERVVVGVEDDDLYAALTDNIVAFEVDRIDGETNLGWTVLVVGRSRPAGDLSLAGFEVPGYELPGATAFPPSDRLIGISVDRLSGLRTVESVVASQSPA
jgi:hypothetical protein